MWRRWRVKTTRHLLCLFPLFWPRHLRHTMLFFSFDFYRFFATIDPSVPNSRLRYVLELFSGCAHLTGACIGRGLRCVCPFDVSEGAYMNLLDVRVQNFILSLRRSGDIWFIWFGTPCSRWSIARSKHVGKSVLCKDGLRCADFTARLRDACFSEDIQYLIENLPTSGLWDYPPISRGLEEHGAVRAVLDQCYFGRPYKKPTCPAGTASFIEGIRARCKCTIPHENMNGLAIFTGKSGHKTSRWKTSFASAYPPAFLPASRLIVLRCGARLSASVPWRTRPRQEVAHQLGNRRRRCYSGPFGPSLPATVRLPL